MTVQYHHLLLIIPYHLSQYFMALAGEANCRRALDAIVRPIEAGPAGAVLGRDRPISGRR
jgi:hypothetical protein